MTDASVYPPPTSAYSEEPDTKKRKRAADDAEPVSGSQVLYTGNMKANTHLRNVHGQVKVDCEELASLCVRIDHLPAIAETDTRENRRN